MKPGYAAMVRLTLICLLLPAAFVLGAPPVQPLPFSHQTHVVDVKLGCTDCHTPPTKFGAGVSLPDAPKCLECHAYSQKASPTKDMLNAFVEKKQTIPWVRTLALKDFVYFDHRFHLSNGAECETCHGPGGTQDDVAARQNTVKMIFCQPCHVKTGARAGCNTCHDAR